MTTTPSRAPARSVRVRAKRLLRAVNDELFLRPRIVLSTWWRAGRHHAAPLAPLSTLAVDPTTIDRWIDAKSVEHYLRNRYQFGVRDGSWDLETVPIDEHFVYASLKARFRQGADWSDTRLFRSAIARIERGSRPYHECRSRDDVERRLASIDALYARIGRDGYRTQAEVRRSEHAPILAQSRRPAVLDEVVVHVGREGRFLLADGVHRFSIARLQGIPSIPVIVLHRHALWQAVRDAVATGDATVGTDETHPDLVGLIR